MSPRQGGNTARKPRRTSKKGKKAKGKVQRDNDKER